MLAQQSKLLARDNKSRCGLAAKSAAGLRALCHGDSVRRFQLPQHRDAWSWAM